MVFYPKLWKTPLPDLYNTYRGLAIERDTLDEVHLDTSIENEEYFKHIRHRWCDGNLDLYNKVLDFFASILQRPWYKMKMCIVLKSAERTGKGLPIQIFKELMGSNYFFQPSSAEEILGNFNANMGSKLLCFIDEMVWGGDKSKAGCLKKLVTESEFTLKQKYMPDLIMDNSINLIMASNEEWVIPAGTTDTRWLVLEVSDELAQMTDKTAKKTIIDDIINIDRKKLAKFFYERDLSQFNDRETIKTNGLRYQQIQSLSKLNKWWLDCLNSGELHNSVNAKTYIEESYQTHSSDRHTTKTKFWIDLKKLTKITVSGGNANKKIEFESLDASRDKWRTIYNDPTWSFDTVDDIE
jgi:hypothetical protein